MEMSDNPIPATYAENTELAAWPPNINMVAELQQNPLVPFIDEVEIVKLVLAL
jgi:hypothetical protein